jgi:RNA polymerase sigma factor (sigma-70 family)
MTSSDATVYIVDDDPSIRTSLARLMRSVNLRAETFASAQDFLEREPPQDSGCVVLDIKMPGKTGLELQQEMESLGVALPIVFLSGHGDVPMSVQAMKHDAVDFLEKPVGEGDLLSAVRLAIDRNIQARRERAIRSEIRERINTLTPRERQALDLVVRGMITKQIAAELGVSEKTAKVHRARMMKKMEAGSVAQLVQMFARQ